MMLDTIFRRRSIRRYTPQPVPQELLETILRAGMAAPSAHNGQPWHFVVVNDRKALDGIPEFHPYAQMLKEAPMAVVVCADLAQREGGDYWTQDCAATTQNMLLAAQELGLGAVWIGVYPGQPRAQKLLRSLLQLPEKVMPFCIVSIGYPAEEKPPADRYDPKKVHYNTWGTKK